MKYPEMKSLKTKSTTTGNNDEMLSIPLECERVAAHTI